MSTNPVSAQQPFSFLRVIEERGTLPREEDQQNFTRLMVGRREIVDKLVDRAFFCRIVSFIRPAGQLSKEDLAKVFVKSNAETVHLVASIFHGLGSKVGCYFSDLLERDKNWQGHVSPGGETFQFAKDQLPGLMRDWLRNRLHVRNEEGQMVERYAIHGSYIENGEKVRTIVSALESGRYFEQMAAKYSILPKDIPLLKMYFSIAKDLVRQCFVTINQFSFYWQDVKTAYTTGVERPLSKSDAAIDEDVFSYIAAKVFFDNEREEQNSPNCLANRCLRLRNFEAHECHFVNLIFLQKMVDASAQVAEMCAARHLDISASVF